MGGTGDGAGPAGGSATGEAEVQGFKDLLRESRERQGRLRHVQQFLASPLFIDLSEPEVTVSDPPEAIEARKRDLDYRIRVLDSMLALLREERGALERTRSADEPPASTAPAPQA